ncbi:MAG: tetratricopeptide repeat protein [Verrucomicrobiae bacterium]|nr:tetratricopeptide repeat protein [Verrucomicrobiae bacterium]
MKRFGMLLLGAVLLWAPSLAAQTPDELFVQVYNLITQADALKETGRDIDAEAKYREALKALEALEKEYPYWNRRVVEYRRQYLTARVGTEPEEPATATPGTSPAPVPQLNPELEALRQEVVRLQAERGQLEARLREALTAQPALVPQAGNQAALQQAQARVAELQRENTALKAMIPQAGTTPTPPPSATPEAQALEQARQAVADLSQQLNALKTRLTAVEAERDALQEKLAGTPVVTPPTTPPTASPAELQAARSQIEALNQALTNEKARTADLEKELKTVSETASRRSEVATNQRVKDLENERDTLLRRVNMLTRQLDEQNVAKGDEAARQISEQLNVLRARIQVYEAQAVPFTPEEMALLSAKPGTGNLTDTARLPTAALPAGVAALVSDAERAFRAERFAEAEQKYTEALTADDTNVHLLANLAACQLQQDKLAEAGATLKKALAKDPMDPDALSLQGLLEFRQEHYDEAEKTLSRAAQVNPDSALTQNYLGVTLSQKGLRKPAETAFRKAIEIDPNYAEAHYNLAVVYARQQPVMPALARFHYEKAVAGGQPRNAELEQIIEEATKK